MSIIGPSPYDSSKPVNIGHRGFRGSYPENTMLALREGIKAGATIVETDIQLASDNVVVMCHDVTTGRCFDSNVVVEETPYHGGLEKLRTKDSFKEPMPTLKQVCEMIINEPEASNAMLMIDIKRSNGPRVVSFVIEVLKSVAPLEVWKKRCVLGVWRLNVMHKVVELAPELDVVFIGFQLKLARKFLEFEQTKGISMNYACYAVRGGPEIIDAARAKHVKIYSWTINHPEAMKWAVASRINGVITDHPDLFQNFLNTISEKDMFSEYFTSNPYKFYSTWDQVQHYCMYLVANAFFFLSDSFPKLFRGV
ncbi:Phosphatidylglycerol phospholipase C [Wickerhamiella sorbophila]|uniref:Phosphatidylglycerol phospholipase C n=1 Tax=Wickerhamiella sorbophila TaxID=45607 RepID=A0A2T0FLD8_9ASCO|nr:Phosphatidylglycerol phospholipase C [Wickerhamiella sorbophila]PRT55790.1 Phosphatidylglycerol phospholipase C [Wickerhamiella sorbophila]